MRVTIVYIVRGILIQKGFKKVKLFSWERTAKEIPKVFGEVINSDQEGDISEEGIDYRD